jgi:hypothetical protein
MTYNGWLTILMFLGVILALIGALSAFFIGAYASATILDGGILLLLATFFAWLHNGLRDNHSAKEQS